MITTGHTIFAHTRAMVTGWEEVEEEAEIQAWETKERYQNEPPLIVIILFGNEVQGNFKQPMALQL
jgi:hypothetical protein